MKTAFLKRVFTVIIAIALFFACGEFLHYIQIDDTKSYTRIMFHQMYNAPQNIDIAFVGSSHVYRALNPNITDKGLGKYTFNAGSSSQALDGSLAMIQEICDHHKPEQIFLELYYAIADFEEYKERKQMVATYILSDYMKPSSRKLNYMLHASSSAHYANSFIPARRSWKDLFRPRYLFNTIRKKQSDDYKNYHWPKAKNQQEYYVDRGFVANDGIINPTTYWNKLTYGKIEKATRLTEQNDWYKSLNDIIRFCDKKKIKLTFIIVPEPEGTIVSKENYQEYHDFIKNIADKNKLEFYDFNFCKAEFFDAKDLTLFKDEQHLNTAGAEKFSSIFSSFFTGKIPKDKLFYNTYKEKLLAERPAFYDPESLHIYSKCEVLRNDAATN